MYSIKYPLQMKAKFYGNVNLCSPYGKQYGGFSKKLKIELPYDPAIPLLDIYPKEIKY